MKKVKHIIGPKNEGVVSLGLADKYLSVLDGSFFQIFLQTNSDQATLHNWNTKQKHSIVIFPNTEAGCLVRGSDRID
jgi:hypothetical protein